MRNYNKWSYVFNLTEMTMCGTKGNTISNVTAKACNHFQNCVNTHGVLSSTSDGVRRVLTTFTNLEENRKYSASVHVQYNGGVVQQSQPVEITTFDVHSISVDGPVIRGRVCLTVEYVDGHEQLPRAFVLFKCTTRECDSQVLIIDGTVQCTQLPPHTSYDIIATDYDASDDINTTAAVTILGVAVPDYTITKPPHTITYSAQLTVTPTTSPTGLVTTSLSQVVVISILVLVNVIVTAYGTIMTVCMCFRCCWKKNQSSEKIGQVQDNNRTQFLLINRMNHGKAAQQGVAGAAAGLSDISYENIDPLSQPSAVKTTQMYENIPTVSSPHHQSKIEMNQCPAYGALM